MDYLGGEDDITNAQDLQYILSFLDNNISLHKQEDKPIWGD